VVFINPDLQSTFCKQRTLKQEASYSGIGVHTGEKVSMRFLPAEENFGIVFKRIDLPGEPIVPAAIEYVVDTSRSTTLGIGKVLVHTVEHVLAAVHALGIDNLVIELSNIEPPIGNGSSDVFVEMIENAGILEQDAEKPIIEIKKPICWFDDDIQMVALPNDDFRISYTLSYPNNPYLKAQFHSVTLTEESFKREIAPCRTFSLYEEVSYLMDKGLIKGGSLDNAVVIKGDTVLSKNGLFFPDEMCRHKILDVIGDLSLIGFRLKAHIMAIKGGHGSNFALGKMLKDYITTESS